MDCVRHAERLQHPEPRCLIEFKCTAMRSNFSGVIMDAVKRDRIRNGPVAIKVVTVTINGHDATADLDGVSGGPGPQPLPVVLEARRRMESMRTQLTCRRPSSRGKVRRRGATWRRLFPSRQVGGACCWRAVLSTTAGPLFGPPNTFTCPGRRPNAGDSLCGDGRGRDG
jgi:hypothetical protein